ncbi:CRISPR-associated endonuclease Cas2 [Natrarchaeobius halalkaliphilus]|uniref:CRISPR-associated endoribonuclease Cas2 n=1 Tax=Natrarchaeobius halalkaliphilus TaxID=1679091 RepID=A0A3N6MGD7_9EURY|nr:CRISPR-associated endonuclease Cas2 [Natrarchaeobius halalkaliphilus]RQG93006.1 CRISPR-associated endonuclease Cas2 [Natrarchaeobius halalkaliphilus]
MRLAITYDVSDDANRRRVYRTLERYGAWKQYSVFELEISKTDRVELEDQLESQISPSDGDRIRIYRLCSACQDATTDLGDEPPDEQSNVI